MGILFINDSWHWAFYANVAMGIFLLSALVLLMHPPYEPKPFLDDLTSVNYLEMIAQLSSVICFLLALAFIAENNQTQEYSGDVAVLFISSAIFLIIFIYMEKKATNPLIPWEFWDKEILVASACALFTGIAFALVAYIPLCCLIIQHAPASVIGLNAFVLLIGFVITSVASAALLKRLNMYGQFLVIGGIFNVIGFGILTAWDQYTLGFEVYMCLLIIGLGK